MKTKILLLHCLLFVSLAFSQTIKFVSANTGDPLSKVLVLNLDGNILASSDINGLVEKSELEPVQEKYILLYDGYQIGTLTSSQLTADLIKLNDREKTIEKIVIKSSKDNKLLVVRGNFSVYVVQNKKLNVYADGIATYIFDKESHKLKSSYVEQYRSFLKQTNQKFDRKNLETAVYDGFLEIPDISFAGMMETSSAKVKNFTQVETSDKTKMQFTTDIPEKVEISLFGYKFSKMKYLNAISFIKGSKNLRDLQEYYQTYSLNLKHKSEPNYHHLETYSAFFPFEITFVPKDKFVKKKIKSNQSSYSYEYWKANGFPNMLAAFNSVFKGEMKEQPNNLKK